MPYSVDGGGGVGGGAEGVGQRTLRELKLEIGDFIDVAVLSDTTQQPPVAQQPNAVNNTAEPPMNVIQS